MLYSMENDDVWIQQRIYTRESQFEKKLNEIMNGWMYE